MQISNEYRFLPDDSYFNQTLIRYTEPFLDGKASVRLTVPLDATDQIGDDEFGLGDIAAKFSWIPYVSRQQAFILSTEVYAPTASEDVLGTGKWVIAPGITWAYFAVPKSSSRRHISRISRLRETTTGRTSIAATSTSISSTGRMANAGGSRRTRR